VLRRILFVSLSSHYSRWDGYRVVIKNDKRFDCIASPHDSSIGSGPGRVRIDIRRRVKACKFSTSAASMVGAALAAVARLLTR